MAWWHGVLALPSSWLDKLSLAVSLRNPPDSKIDISTLLASHPSLSGASALLPSKADPTSSSILKQGVLPAPLPTVVQERLDREAAYEKTKEEGAKWSGVMKRIKEAEHLSFPLQASDRGGTKSAGEMIASFKPTNPLESAITSLLKQANLTDQAMKQHEDEALAGQDLSLEEIEARRAQLRQQRELMFRAEAKAKRVAKIKSKTFRKLARKRAEKAGISVEDLERLDPEAAEQEREKQERQRAKERATLRHGAGGKFGRETAGGTTFGLEDRRKAREDMLDMRERLQRKIAGRGDGESDDDDDEEESDEDEDDDDIKAAAFNQLARLDGKDSAGEQQGKKGLMQMKFMQKAQDREMRKVAEEEQALREEIRLFGEEKGEGSGEEEDDEDDEGPQMMKLGEGRMVFSGPAKVGAVVPRSRLLPLCSPRSHLLLHVHSLLFNWTIANKTHPVGLRLCGITCTHCDGISSRICLCTFRRPCELPPRSVPSEPVARAHRLLRSFTEEQHRLHLHRSQGRAEPQEGRGQGFGAGPRSGG